jgi:hypothetical protein
MKKARLTAQRQDVHDLVEESCRPSLGVLDRGPFLIILAQAHRIVVLRMANRDELGASNVDPVGDLISHHAIDHSAIGTEEMAGELCSLVSSACSTLIGVSNILSMVAGPPDSGMSRLGRSDSGQRIACRHRRRRRQAVDWPNLRSPRDWS